MMDIRLRVGIDFDGVIIDHHDNKRRLLAERGLTVEPWQLNTNFMKHAMDEGVYRGMQDILYTTYTPMAPPVREALETLAAVPADLYIICPRAPMGIRFAQDWLGKHRVYDFVPAERVFFCGTSEDKRGYCQRLGLHAFMDDKLAALRGLPPNVKCLLFDEDGASERLTVDQDTDIIRSWREFKSLFEQE